MVKKSNSGIRNQKTFLRDLAQQTTVLCDRILTIVRDHRDAFFMDLKARFDQYLFIEMEVHRDIHFADLLAQTITYGHFLGWLEHCLNSKSSKAYEKQLTQTYLTSDDPFIMKVFDCTDNSRNQAIADCEDGIIDILNTSEFDNIFPQRENIYQVVILTFYEKFLTYYNRALQMERGAIYTPIPVVDFMIRSIDYLLIQRFSLSKGIATIESPETPSIKYLDPAAGTMTFPARLAVFAKNTFAKTPQHFTAWVKHTFLKKVFAFEIMMAPFILGQLKIRGVLRELEYHFAPEDKPLFFLANSLFPPASNTRDQANVKEWPLNIAFRKDDSSHQTEQICVIMGNPPYNTNNKIENQSQWITTLMQDYKDGVVIDNVKRLHDDYVRFIRFAQWEIQQHSAGIISFITNNAYLDGPSFIGMRKALYAYFDEIYIVNLHGNLRKNYRGIPDKNIFDVRVGVAIIILVKLKSPKREKRVLYYEKLGDQSQKEIFLSKFDLQTLIEAKFFEELVPEAPDYRFLMMTQTLEEENHLHRFKSFPSITDIFIEHRTGTFSHRDSLVVGDRVSVLQKNLALFFNGELTTLKERGVKITNTRDWNYDRVIKNKLSDIPGALEHLTRYLYRGFLRKYLVFDQALLEPGCDRKEAQMQLSPENPALLLTSGLRILPYNHVFITDIPVDSNAFRFSSVEFFPLKWNGIFNFHNKFVKLVKNQFPELKLEEIPEILFYYIYGILYATQYRQMYAYALIYEFPRIPMPRTKILLIFVSELGKELAKLHLIIEKEVYHPRFLRIAGNWKVQFTNFQYLEDEQKIIIESHAEQYVICPVPSAVWNFTVGGYIQLPQWLRNFKGLEMTDKEFNYFLEMIENIAQTLEIIEKIDKIYPEIDC